MNVSGWNWRPYEATARRLSLQYGVAPELILAVMGIESAFNPRAYRYEATLKDASRGLMQLLLSTARSLGFAGAPEQLYDADVNANLGTKYLAQQLRRYGGSIPDALSAYNGGHALRLGSGYVNQSYVDKGLAAWQGFTAALAPAGTGGTPTPGTPGTPPSPPAPVGDAGSLGVLLAVGFASFALWRWR